MVSSSSSSGSSSASTYEEDEAEDKDDDTWPKDRIPQYLKERAGESEHRPSLSEGIMLGSLWMSLSFLHPLPSSPSKVLVSEVMEGVAPLTGAEGAVGVLGSRRGRGTRMAEDDKNWGIGAMGPALPLLLRSALLRHRHPCHALSLLQSFLSLSLLSISVVVTYSFLGIFICTAQIALHTPYLKNHIPKLPFSFSLHTLTSVSSPSFQRHPHLLPSQQCPPASLLPVFFPAPPPSPLLAPPPSLPSPPPFLALFPHSPSPALFRRPPAFRHRPSSAPSAPSLSAPFGQTGPNGGPMLKSRGGASRESMCRKVGGGFWGRGRRWERGGGAGKREGGGTGEKMFRGGGRGCREKKGKVV